MAEASGIQAKFTADISDIQGKLDILTGQLTKVGSTTAQTAQGFALGGIALEALNKAFSLATGFLESGFQEYTKINQAMGQFDVLASNTKSGLNSYSDVLDKQVNNALANTTYSHLQVVDALSQFAKYGIDASKAATMLQTAEDASAGSGQSLETVVTALQRSAQGLSSRGLVQLGVDMTEVKNSGDKLGDVMKQLTKYHGDAAEMAKTLSGQETQLNNNFDEIKTQVIAQVVPAFNSMLSSILGVTKGMADNTQAQQNIQKITYQVIEGFKALYDVLNVVIDGTLTFGSALASIPAISIAVITDLLDNWKKVPEMFEVIGSNIGKYIKAAFTGGKPDIKKLPQMAFEATQQTAGFFKDMTTGLALETADSFGKLGTDMAGMIDGTGFKATELGSKLGNLATGGAADMTNLTDSTKKMSDEMTKFATGIDDAAQKHKEAIDKIESDVSTLTKDYAQSNTDAASSHADSVASIVKTHQDKVTALKQQLLQETEYGQNQDQVQIANTQSQLAQELAFLQKHSSDVASVQTQLNEDELDKEDKKYTEDEAKRKEAYNTKLSDLKTQLNTENSSYEASLAKMADDFTGNWANILNYIKTTATPKIVAAFDDMVKQSNAKLSSLGIKGLGLPEIKTTIPGKKQHATGGMITETGVHLLHAGEQVISRSQVDAGKGSGSNISVNFYGAMNISKEADENRLADKIRNVMMKDLQLSQHGLY